jgi:hypothetical protein
LKLGDDKIFFFLAKHIKELGTLMSTKGLGALELKEIQGNIANWITCILDWEMVLEPE